MDSKRKKIFIGMSGGVDSSVAAALLQKDGYEVVGVFIKVWQADFLPCSWREERRDAMRIASQLGIPFLTLDLEREYKKEVVDYMIREYGAGRVPNPDIMCNKHVKFGAFLNFALAHGADFIATGHYARIQEDRRSKIEQNSAEFDIPVFRLLAGVDKEKDQSYFLWTLTQKELAHTLFPIGHLQKKEVRELARTFGLLNAEKKDSQGLCFMGAVDMPEFLKYYLKTVPGDVCDKEGATIGRHDGAMLYTIGQRHGFSTIKRTTDEEPYFVTSKDIKENTITVSHRELAHRMDEAREISIKELNLISDKSSYDAHLTARIRYRGKLIPANITFGDNDTASVIFPSGVEEIAAGQSMVFYRDEECLGGGVIT